jgi:SAM-dependent methyltransferase
MGVNLEYVATLLDLKARGALPPGGSAVDLGAQDISAAPDAVSALLVRNGVPAPPRVDTAAQLYAALGFTRYVCIDSNGLHDALVFDLNSDITQRYGFNETFDLVSNLGTFEHCFNQAEAFGNAHRLCRPGGIMIHCLPTQGLVNHGFYNYHPRFVADLSAANRYAIEDLFFTEDFTPTRHPYSVEAFQRRDDRDLMLYALLRRPSDEAAFAIPFDGMYAAENRVGAAGGPSQAAVLAGDFRPYIKTSWENVRMPLDSPSTELT